MTSLKRKARVITSQNDSQKMKICVECQSEDGITIGLIDAIMTCCAALKGRELSHGQVVEALKDLRADEVLRALLFEGVMGFNYEKISCAYEIDALERAMQPER